MTKTIMSHTPEDGPLGISTLHCFVLLQFREEAEVRKHSLDCPANKKTHTEREQRERVTSLSAAASPVHRLICFPVV